MTAQISDTFLFKGEEYTLVGMSGGELITPYDFGMKPEALHTACWRGFYSTYEISADEIFLKDMTMREKDGNYKPINNILPEVTDGEAHYLDVHMRISFTGKVRIAKDFINELYIHMGFQKPSAFRKVLDLSFEDGLLIDVKDRSEEMEQKRGAFKKEYESKDITEGIDEAFSLDMDVE